MQTNLLFLIILNLNFKNIISTVFLNKFEKKTVSVTDLFIYFNSTDFKKGEKIYFKISSQTFKHPYLSFEFFDDEDPKTNYNPGTQDKTYRTKEDDKAVGELYYFTIKKENKYLKNLEGKYLTIYFYCNGDDITIENYDKPSGKVPLYIIIIFTIVVIVAVIVAVLFYCIKKKKISNIYSRKGASMPSGIQINNNLSVDNQSNEGNGQSSSKVHFNSYKNNNMHRKKNNNISNTITIYNKNSSNNSEINNIYHRNNFRHHSSNRKIIRSNVKHYSKKKKDNNRNNNNISLN